MTAERFLVEPGHITMFARAIGDSSPAFDLTVTDPGDVIAPPTFVQASAQFDPDYYLRPKVGGEGWFGSGAQPSGLRPGGGGGGSDRPSTGGLHAEQHFEYHRPIVAGDVLSARTLPGRTWEKQSRTGSTLKFGERITEYVDETGEVVVTARGVGVQIVAADPS